MNTVRLPKRFQLVRELGRGGMGTVYEAIDAETGEHVAVKTLSSRDPRAIAGFKREFESLAGLRHPNLVGLRELFCEEEEWAFSMDLVSGTDLLGYVWQGSPGAHSGDRPRFDEARLRDVFTQLTNAVAAIHEAGKLHRDLKPSNVRVTNDGHLFLLDFGLVAEVATVDGDPLRDDELSGTVSYMAPEQASNGAIGPFSDFYALGAMLFEALTGRLPFEGPPAAVLQAKLERDAPFVRSLAPEAPFDLEELSARLLEFNPVKRPNASAILAALAGGADTATGTSFEGEGESPFVGRRGQLELLESSFARVMGGARAVVLLEGESGTGKSRLARRFLARMRDARRDAVILTGRCYEYEGVAFNAWDNAIESLASYWARLDDAAAMALVPERIESLAQTFPSLRRVKSVARAALLEPAKLDPHELRSRAFTALREVFAAIARSRPLVVYLDDIQWADHDSASLIAEVLRDPSPPSLLLLAAARPLKYHPLAERELRDAFPRDTQRCQVSELPLEEATELARSLLLREAPELVSQADSIAEEADGQALFIAELVRHARLEERGRSRASLADALVSRVATLPEDARTLLSVLALAARPIPESVAMRAASVAAKESGRALSALAEGNLVRVTRKEGVVWLETYHDRIRDTFAHRISPEDRAALFAELARAFEASRYGDAGLLTELWKSAGDAEKAGIHARVAADAALRALTFDRAADLLKTALDRPSCSGGERHDLLVLLADTLSNAGRGKEAADAYRAAQQGAAGPSRALEIEQKACEQLLRSGYFDEGLVAAKRVVRKVGLRFPASVVEALFWISLLRLYLALRRRSSRGRSPGAAAPEDLVRLDVCFNMGGWLMMADSTRAGVFAHHQVRLALRTGEPRHLAIASAYEVVIVASMSGSRAPSGHRKLEAAIARAESVALLAGGPYERALCDFGVGTALALGWRPREAIRRLSLAERAFREELSGRWAEISHCQTYTLFADFFLGEYRDLAVRQSQAVSEAVDRRDLFASVTHRIGFSNFAWLVQGAPDAAKNAVAEAAREYKGRPFSLHHHWGFIALANVALFEGDALGAAELVRQSWPELRRSGLRWLLPANHFESSELRARTCLALARERPRDRQEELAKAKRWASDVGRGDFVYDPSTALLLRAEIATVAGDPEQAVALLRAAIPALLNVDLCGYVAVAKRALGKLVKGDEGAALVREGEDFLRGQTVKNIPALCLCLAPGFAELG